MPVSYAGKNKRAVNYLKTVYFDYPQWTPARIGLLPAAWIRYRDELEDIVLAHPRVFPGFKKGDVDFSFPRFSNPLYELGNHTDSWGTVWRNIQRGMDSHPAEYPLADWKDLPAYTPPDPETDDIFGPRDWYETGKNIRRARERGEIAAGRGLPHGFMYMRLTYLRGFQNLMLDIAAEDPRLDTLIAMVEEYNRAVTERVVDLGAEFIYFGEDLGLQDLLPMSPRAWRRYIKPSYNRIFAPCREKDVIIYLHTDGHVLEIIPDLIETGVKILNPQYRANGLEGLVRYARGRVALDQDLDRQLFPFAVPDQIEEHVEKVHETLHSPEGGLMLLAECGPDVPLTNIEAICTAMERVCGLPRPDTTPPG